jgi:hypothetical protein
MLAQYLKLGHGRFLRYVCNSLFTEKQKM